MTHTFVFNNRHVSYRTDYVMHACEWAAEYLELDSKSGFWEHFGDVHVWRSL